MDTSIIVKPQFEEQEALQYDQYLDTILTFGNGYEDLTARIANDESLKQRFKQYCFSQANDPKEKKCLISYFIIAPSLVKTAKETPEQRLEAFSYSKQFVGSLIESAQNIERYEVFSHALKGYCLYLASKEIKLNPRLAGNYYSKLGFENSQAFRRDFIATSQNVSRHLPFGSFLLAHAHDSLDQTTNFLDEMAYFHNLEVAAHQGCHLALLELSFMFFSNPRMTSTVLHNPLNFEEIRNLLSKEKSTDALEAYVQMMRHGIGGAKMNVNEIYDIFMEYLKSPDFKISQSLTYGRTVQFIIGLELCLDRYNELDEDVKREALFNFPLFELMRPNFELRKNDIVQAMLQWILALDQFVTQNEASFKKLSLDIVLRYHYVMSSISSIIEQHEQARNCLKFVVAYIGESLTQGWSVDILRKIMLESYYKYAKMLYLGQGGPKNKKEALKYFELALKSGCLEAEDFIGLIKAEQKEEIKAQRALKKELQHKKIVKVILEEREIRAQEEEKREKQELARMQKIVSQRCIESRRIPLVTPEWVDYAIRAEEAKSVTQEVKEKAKEKIQHEEEKAALKAEKPRPEGVIEDVFEETSIIEEDPSKSYRLGLPANHLELFQHALGFAANDESEEAHTRSNDNKFKGHHGLSNIVTKDIIEMLKALGCSIKKINGKKQGKGSHTTVTIPRIDLNQKAQALEGAKTLEGVENRIINFPNKDLVLKVYIRNLALFLSELGYTSENVLDVRG